MALIISCAKAERPEVAHHEIVDSLWSFRVDRPSKPWAVGRGNSAFSEIGAAGDYIFHNQFTGGVMSIRVFPLNFRYRHFRLTDHARRMYWDVLSGWGNDMRALKDGRFSSNRSGLAYSVEGWSRNGSNLRSRGASPGWSSTRTRSEDGSRRKF